MTSLRGFRVLLIDDDATLAAMLSEYLASYGLRRIARYHGGDARCLPRPRGGSIFEVDLSEAPESK